MTEHPLPQGALSDAEINAGLRKEIDDLRAMKEHVIRVLTGPADAAESSVEHLEGWAEDYGDDIHGEWLWRIAQLLKELIDD